MDDVSGWLAEIGLGQYAQLFSDNAVDGEVLIDLTEEDLAGLGIVLGHRHYGDRLLARSERQL